MSASKIHLEIVTPDQQLFSGEVDEVKVPGIKGELGILPGHAALLSELKVGVIRYRQGDRESVLYCDWGFTEILPDQVSVLVERAETPAEIDRVGAQKDRERALQELRSKDPSTDYQGALRLLEKATARIEVSQSG